MTWLVNENSDQPAAEYPDKVAEVLLNESTGWHRADPDTGTPVPEEASGTSLDLDNPAHDNPPSAGDPDGGNAGNEKE